MITRRKQLFWITYLSYIGTFFSTAFISNISRRMNINRNERYELNANRNNYEDVNQLSSTRKVFFKEAITKTVSIGAGVCIASCDPLPASATISKQTNDSLQSLQKKSTSTNDVLSTLQSINHIAPYANGGTAIVTGGNSGIGLETVISLAKAGMNVIMCSRRMEAGLEAINNLPNSVRDKVSVQQLNLADMASVQSASKEIINHPFVKQGKIDVIINNAGVIDKKGTPILSSQGLELQFGINHVGHHMFTRLLLPSLNQNGRIVTVASEAHRFGKANTAVEGKGGYSGSKLCNIWFAEALQDRLNSIGRTDIKSVSLHPGVINTQLFNGSSGLWAAVPYIADKTIEQGAATTVLCALLDNENISGGKYYNDCQEFIPSDVALDISREKRDILWANTESIINDNGFVLPSRII